jgi:hypothetical protein
MSLISIVFILLISLYLGEITSKFIESPVLQKYKTLQDLFEAGYKLVLEKYTKVNFLLILFGWQLKSKLRKGT